MAFPIAIKDVIRYTVEGRVLRLWSVGGYATTCASMRHTILSVKESHIVGCTILSVFTYITESYAL